MSALEMQIRAIEANSVIREALLEEMRRRIRYATEHGRTSVDYGWHSRSQGPSGPPRVIPSSIISVKVRRRFFFWKRETAEIDGVTDVLRAEGYRVSLVKADRNIFMYGTWILEVEW